MIVFFKSYMVVTKNHYNSQIHYILVHKGCKIHVMYITGMKLSGKILVIQLK